MKEHAFQVYVVARELEEINPRHAINHYLLALSIDGSFIGAYNRIEEIVGEGMDNLIEEIGGELGGRLERIRRVKESFKELSSLLKGVWEK